MAKAEKASEPTMDEILASIRKIIAEEPVGKKSGNSGEGGKGVDFTDAFAAPRASLDDILGMADAPGRAAPEAKASGGTPGTADSSWPFGAPAAKGGSSAEPARGAPEPMRPFFPAPAAPKADRASENEAGKVSGKTDEHRVGELGAIVPRKPFEAPGEADGADRKSLAGRLPDWLSRPATGLSPGQQAAASGGSKDLPAGAEVKLPEPGPAMRAGDGDGTDKSTTAASATPAAGAGAAGAAVGASAAGRPASASASSVTPVAAPRPTAGPASEKTVSPNAMHASTGAPKPEAGGQAKTATPGGTAAAAPKPPQGAVAAAAAPTAKAQVPSAVASSNSGGKPAQPNAAPAAAAAEKVAGSTAPVPVPETMTVPVAKPAVLDKSKAVRPAPQGDLLAAAAAGGGVRTLDDTIIELLRPMIRQWLDDNMPRMVEKALRIELAASLQARGDGAKSDPSKH